MLVAGSAKSLIAAGGPPLEGLRWVYQTHQADRADQERQAQDEVCHSKGLSWTPDPFLSKMIKGDIHARGARYFSESSCRQR
jgi:hypothetical protein